QEREPLERADDDAVRRHPHERLRRELQSRVLQQDRAFERLQGSTGVQPELAVQELPRLTVDLERVRLPACAIEREHQLAAQALPKRVLRDERLQLADELLVAAKREIGVDTVGERRQVNLLESPDLRLRKGLVGEIRERRSAPEREGFEKRPCRQPRSGSRRPSDQTSSGPRIRNSISARKRRPAIPQRPPRILCRFYAASMPLLCRASARSAKSTVLDGRARKEQ